MGQSASARDTILKNYPEVGNPGTLGHLLDLYALELGQQITTLPVPEHWTHHVRMITKQARKEAARAIAPTQEVSW